jgi:hypothetical protein
LISCPTARVNDTLAEMDYLYTQQKLCNSVAAYTTYSSHHLGDPPFALIWDRLQEYKALVFIHPRLLDVQPAFLTGNLP